MKDQILTLLNEICASNYTNEWENLNYKLIPTTAIKAEIGSEKKFNELYQALLNSDYKKITRTKSGGISIKKEFKYYVHNAYDVKVKGTFIELTVLTNENDQMKSYRIQYRGNNYKTESEEHLITGTESFKIFSRTCKKYGIDLSRYEVSPELGFKINETIRKPEIKIYNEINLGRTFEHVYHLDFHKFYMSGLLLSHEEFEKPIRELADKAKTDPKYKTVLAATIGYFHSSACRYRYAQLAKDAIETAYSRFDEVYNELGWDYNIIAANTDGLFYYGPGEFHGFYEGDDLTEWSNDHKDIKIRFKSAGAYEYIEDGQYHAVVRGKTNLDRIKSRDTWTWGDIYDYNADIQVFTFREGEGIVWRNL